MCDFQRKWCHFSFMGNFWPIANNRRKRLILFVTVLVIVEERLTLLTLLNIGLSRQFYSEMLLKIGENTF